jgi:hypothetical protein
MPWWWKFLGFKIQSASTLLPALGVDELQDLAALPVIFRQMPRIDLLVKLKFFLRQILLTEMNLRLA